MSQEHRQAQRIVLNTPVILRAIGQPKVALHPNLERIYERVNANTENAGSTYTGVLRDVSVNGAFIAGQALPLLSRVELSFELPDFGRVNALGWILWRRTEDCHLPVTDEHLVTLPRGFGVLFEAISMDARLAIQELVSANT